ncbi:MAG: ribulokinase [Atribacterota bacterium]|nr:ribulokinase [Atribacterota bacterium]
MSNYVIGLDFGTDSVRSLLVDVQNGNKIKESVASYNRWNNGHYCSPLNNQFRQHPLDYLEAMDKAIQKTLRECSKDIMENIVAIGVDTTGSTPCAVDREGIPLALLENFKDEPDAMFVLWKDHTAIQEAEEINQKAKNWGGNDFTKYIGGTYSSEWFWAKALHILRNNEKIRKSAFSWVEQCDWITAVLTGITDPLQLKRSRCAAGHKAMWHEEWNGLPDVNFLQKIDPLLAELKSRLYQQTYTSDKIAGTLNEQWAQKYGLKKEVVIAVGSIDAHTGAIGGGIKEETLVKIMGTSTCDIVVASPKVIKDKLIAGICGQVNGSVIPGLIGLEAGQSAFGDIYAWFRDVLFWPTECVLPKTRVVDQKTINQIQQETRDKIISILTEEAEKINTVQTELLAIDWLNGRRTPFADQGLTGAILGLNLGSNAVLIFKALVESTAFGARAINEQFQKEGIKINEVIALGGIAQKNNYVIQILSDVLNMPIKISKAEQACALGSAMLAATSAGVFENVKQAQEKMSAGFLKTYYPRKDFVSIYNKLYKKYLNAGSILEKNLKTD